MGGIPHPGRYRTGGEHFRQPVLSILSHASMALFRSFNFLINAYSRLYFGDFPAPVKVSLLRRVDSKGGI